MHIILIYFGVLLGVFLEGEMIMISSIIAAHHGYLNIWLVVLIGIVGTYSSDCFYFSLGRKKGKKWLNKNQKFKDKVSIIDQKLIKFPILIFLIYRFAYGIRTIAPLVIGASKTKTKTFHFFSAGSIIIWAALYSLIGYMFGELIKSKLSYIEHIEKYIIGSLIVLGIISIVFFRVRNLKKIHFKTF